MQETALSAEDMHENAIHDDGKQSNGETMAIEEPSIENPSSFTNYYVCLKESSGALTCEKCSQNVHAICGHSPKDDDDNEVEGYVVSILCTVCFNIEKAIKYKMESKSNLEMQAKRMKRGSDKKCPPAPLGASVQVPIPDVDKGRGDLRNLLAVVMSMTEDGFYRPGTAQGILKQLYARSEFTVCPKDFMKAEDVPDLEIAFQSAATSLSTGSGQGFVRCMCKTKCQTMRCLCVKKKIKCNLKCHSSLPCCNK
ncbi:uncharacterized protein [Palaemon carinicauda]|uniref:uncharacterized protein n=1 Tax=Palaemon carinicauda TaxID=392227 RepID=UPI0035B69771